MTCKDMLCSSRQLHDVKRTGTSELPSLTKLLPEFIVTKLDKLVWTVNFYLFPNYVSDRSDIDSIRTVKKPSSSPKRQPEGSTRFCRILHRSQESTKRHLSFPGAVGGNDTGYLSWKAEDYALWISRWLCSIRLSHWRINKWEKLHNNKNGRKTCSWKEQRPPMPHLKLIWYFWHEGRDLFHEPVYTALTARLQQGGDGEGSDTAVGVGDEVFQVKVAGSDCRWMLHGHL